MIKDAIKLDSNNIESGLWLPENLRYYINKRKYVHKHGMFAQALRASIVILKG